MNEEQIEVRKKQLRTNKHDCSKKTWDSITPVERPMMNHIKTGKDRCKWTLLPTCAEKKRRTDVGHIPGEIGAQLVYNKAKHVTILPAENQE